MLKFEWNALGHGDRVHVHDKAPAELRATGGTVVMVEARRVKRGVNGVGIRLDELGGAGTVWPSYLAVHREPVDSEHGCWRCDALIEASPTRPPALVPTRSVLR